MFWGFPGGTVVKSLQCRRHRFDPWVRKISWSRKCNPLQYSCLENSVDRGAWWAVFPKGQTRLSAQARGSILEMFPRRMHVSFSYFRYVLSLQVSSHFCISQTLCIDELFYFRCLVYSPKKYRKIKNHLKDLLDILNYSWLSFVSFIKTLIDSWTLWGLIHM